MMEMRASVLTGVERLELANVPRPDPGPGEVLVEVAAVGLCGTDFHIFAGESNYNFGPDGVPIPLEREPQILGHEIAGVVRELGPGVTPQSHGVAPGQSVVVDQGRNCRSEARTPECEYCASGDSHQCEHYTEHGITGLPGGFADYVAVPALNCIATAGELAPDRMALTEPLGCVLHSSERADRAHARFGLNTDEPARRVRTALICGGGPAGLLFLQVLRQVYGFQGNLLLSDPNAAKRELAEALGATAIDPSDPTWVEQVRELTQGRGVEYLVEASGSGPVFADLPVVLRKQGTLLLYGIGHGGAGLELLNPIQWKEPTAVLSVGASGGFDADGRPSIYRRALGLIEEGRIEVEPLITNRYAGLDELPVAFGGDHRSSAYVKGVALLGAD